MAIVLSAASVFDPVCVALLHLLPRLLADPSLVGWAAGVAVKVCRLDLGPHRVRYQDALLPVLLVALDRGDVHPSSIDEVQRPGRARRHPEGAGERTFDAIGAEGVYPAFLGWAAGFGLRRFPSSSIASR